MKNDYIKPHEKIDLRTHCKHGVPRWWKGFLHCSGCTNDALHKIDAANRRIAATKGETDNG